MNYLSTPVGYARVRNGPLDKYDVFSSVQDMLNYCNTGPAFDGHIIACKLSNGSIQQFIIKNNRPVPIFSNMELITKTFDDSDDIYILVSVIDDSEAHNGMNLTDIYAFDITPMQSIFTNGEEAEIKSVGDKTLVYNYIKATQYVKGVRL